MTNMKPYAGHTVVEIDDIEGEIHISQDETVKASFENLRWILKHHQYRYFVWNNDTEDNQPLLVDAMTAQVLVAVHDAVLEGNEEKAAKMRCLIRKDRLNFGNIVEKCWSCVR